jgi:hypothetical protein
MRGNLHVGLPKTDKGQDSLAILVLHKELDNPERQLVMNLGMDELNVTTIISKKPRGSARPAQGGDSIGDSTGETGTFACIVKNASGEELILSCNHVIASLGAGLSRAKG